MLITGTKESSVVKKLFLFLLCVAPATYAFNLSQSQGYLNGYCGAYASVIKKASSYGSSYEVFSNAANRDTLPCPGAGCPGIVKYSGNKLTQLSYDGIVASNSIIDDVFDSYGKLADNRMFSRPVVKRDGAGYAAVAMVMNGYFPPDGMGTPAFLTSPDGIHWTYKGKFKGEPADYIKKHTVFASGMGLIISESAPRYRFYTDGYGVDIALAVSDDGINWKFVRESNGSIAELKPFDWGNNSPIFTSVSEYPFSKPATYYMASSDGWPVKGWMFAHSTNGLDWVHDKYVPVYNSQKNISLFTDGNKLLGLGTSGVKYNCFKKTIRQLTQKDLSAHTRWSPH